MIPEEEKLLDDIDEEEIEDINDRLKYRFFFNEDLIF